MLIDDYKSQKLPQSLSRPVKFTFATSYAAKDAIKHIADDLCRKIKNLSIDVSPVKSEYWGQNITVAGLITSDDLIKAVSTSDGEVVVIPSVMLRPYSEDFLDGKSLDYVKTLISKPFIVISNNYSIKEFIDMLYKI